MLPILNAILSFFNQLIGESMLENICNWTNELLRIDINLEKLSYYIGLFLLLGVLKKTENL